MRLAQVATHSPETLGLAGIVAGLLLFLTGYVVGAQTQGAACPPAAVQVRSELEGPASDGREHKVKTIMYDTPVPDSVTTKPPAK
ncbi:MAG: hypothetical protein WAK01_05830 [Methylocystis sp.]